MNRLRIAAAYEVVAGLVGLGLAFRSTAIPNGNGITFNIYIVALALGSVVAGGLTWAGIQGARQISLLFQIIQIPRLSSSAFVFGILVGVEGTVRFHGPLMNGFATVGVTAVALRPAGDLPTIIGINLVAVAVAGLLWSHHAPPWKVRDATDSAESESAASSRGAHGEVEQAEA